MNIGKMMKSLQQGQQKMQELQTTLERLEIVINGDRVVPLRSQNKKSGKGGHESLLESPVEITETSWLAVRTYESWPGGRVRFAHTAPWYVEVAGKPLRPRKIEVEFLSERVEQQLRQPSAERGRIRQRSPCCCSRWC